MHSRRAALVMAVTVGTLLVVAMQGSAASAPQSGGVRIADAETSNLFAQVAVDGSLQVAGEVSLVGAPQVGVAGVVTTQAAPATTHRSVEFTLAPGEVSTASVPDINGTFISIWAADDDVAEITFTSTDFTPAFSVGGETQTLPSVITIPFSQSIHVNRIVGECHNTTAQCRFKVSIVGMPSA